MQTPAQPSTPAQPTNSQTASATRTSPDQAAAAANADRSTAANRASTNKANAQFSTGPQSPEGKAKVALNALKTGLTGRTVLLPGDDAARYAAHLERYTREFAPESDDEKELVHCLADTQWRLNRIPALEMNLFALGAIEFAGKFDAYPADTRAGLIQAHTFMVWMRQFNNLSIQEVRLQRRYDKALAALKTLRAEREQQRCSEIRQAAQLYLLAKKENRPFDPQALGFEFSIREIEMFLELLYAQRTAPNAGFIARTSAQAA